MSLRAFVHRSITHVRARQGSRAAAIVRGHTIVELLIVLVLMSSLAGMAMPRINYVALRLDGNVRSVRGVLQQAWRSAVQNQHDILVSIDTSGRRMRVVEDQNNDGLITAGERITWRPLEDGVKFEAPGVGVFGAVTGAVVGSGLRTVTAYPTITFRRNGLASGDVEIYLSAKYKTVLHRRAITLAQQPGRTDWFRQVNTVWRSGGI